MHEHGAGCIPLICRIIPVWVSDAVNRENVSTRVPPAN